MTVASPDRLLSEKIINFYQDDLDYLFATMFWGLIKICPTKVTQKLNHMPILYLFLVIEFNMNNINLL